MKSLNVQPAARHEVSVVVRELGGLLWHYRCNCGWTIWSDDPVRSSAEVAHHASIGPVGAQKD